MDKSSKYCEPLYCILQHLYFQTLMTGKALKMLMLQVSCWGGAVVEMPSGMLELSLSLRRSCLEPPAGAGELLLSEGTAEERICPAGAGVAVASLRCWVAAKGLLHALKGSLRNCWCTVEYSAEH